MRLPLLVLLTAAALFSFGSFATQSEPATAATTVVMYGTTGAGNTLSSLYRIDPATGAGTLIGPTGYRGISGIDFHPQTGMLYGVGRRQSDDAPVLIRINTATGAATEVGPTQALPQRFPDLAFRHSDSTLFAWTFPPERLATISVATGLANVFGAVTPVGSGDALAFDFSGTLFHASGASLGTVDQTTGVFTTTATLTPNPPGATFAPIAAMKFHPQTATLYGVLLPTSGGSQALLAVIHPQTGGVTVIGATVPGMDSLAFQPAAPSVSKTFDPSTIASGQTTTLSFAVTNPNLVSLSGVGFTDQLPEGLSVASPNGLTGSCGGGTISAMAGSTTITLANASLGPSASCSFSVSLIATSQGTLTNTTGTISANQSGAGGTASATLSVGPEPLKMPSPIPQVFQNPGAIAILNSQPVRTPTPIRSPAAAASAPVAMMPVLRPPSTGDAGLKLE